MQVEIVVPQMGESISEATVASWLKAKGERVAEGDVLVELETDKVMVEVPAAESGILQDIHKGTGETVTVGDILGLIETEGAGAAAPAGNGGTPAQAPAPAPPPKPAPAAATAAPAAQAEAPRSQAVGPAARRLAAEQGVDIGQVPGTGPRGQVTKADVQHAGETARPAAEPTRQAPPTAPPAAAPRPVAAAPTRAPGEREERVKMTRLRQRIAERLVEAQQTAAILTTFNEVDMSATMAMRSKYKDAFREKYGIALGFMSVFTKACIEALKAFPAVNGEIRGDEIIYKHYYDIGVAVGTERGLVVPVVRDADRKSFIEIELEIAELARKARENKLTMDDLTGGTFSISNGGIYGSMLSTPILNPPQVAILGMHNIVKRAVVVDDEVVVRPMMYLALSYDHRIIDGREAVQFLVRMKECIEDPARILLEI
ncbi:MAG TPA: 2-oxoglutarate dehydrogenase complex dihydrolipoyllysine-residue succinyltransferase [bacterium]|nr:2-oxoglutarate dehydrogenase complex dihydrolipoyllysine-residue succinyltransferase [bacterium]